MGVKMGDEEMPPNMVAREFNVAWCAGMGKRRPTIECAQVAQKKECTYMKKIKISEQWHRRVVVPALNNWKSGAPRQKAASIIYGLLDVQRTCGKQGHKYVAGLPVVSVSRKMLEDFYRDKASRKKFSRWVEATGLVRKDRSWLNASLAKKVGEESRCDTWHVTEPDHPAKRHIVVEYDPNVGVYGSCRKAIISAEGKAVDGANVFAGKWAIDEQENGHLSLSDFMEVGLCARNILEGVKTASPSCRVYDAFALCKKDLRGRCFVNAMTGRGVKEVFDIPGAATFTAQLAGSVFPFRQKGYPINIDCANIRAWAVALHAGKDEDPYERIWKEVFRVDPKTNAYGEWNKSTRKNLKMDFQCVANCDMDYLAECEKAYTAFFAGNRHVAPNKRRQWLVWMALKTALPSLWALLLVTKYNGTTGAFFRLHTMGEKMVMNMLIKKFANAGFVVHRVHDALWTSDEELTRMSQSTFNMCVGGLLLRDFPRQTQAGFGQQAMQRLAVEAGISEEEIRWVRDGLKLKEFQKDVARDVVNCDGYYGI